MVHNKKLITDFKEKSGIFNFFFAKQCSLIDHGSILPSLFHLITTDKSLSDIDFSIEDIKNILSKLDSSKAHGDDMISIRMLKLCVFKSCLTQGICLTNSQKNDKQCDKQLQTSQSVSKFSNVLFITRCSHIL